MKKTIFLDKYPVYTLEIMKDEMELKTTKEVVEYFVEKVEKHPVTVLISVFDHYSHTKKLDGDMVEGLIDAQNVVFCFGASIPNTKILAARPRSIGICEFEDKFIIEFIEAPKEQLNDIMEGWSKALKV